MTSIAHHRSLVILLSFCLASFVFAQSNFRSLAQSDGEAAVGALVEQYFAAWQKEDLDAAIGLWSEKSPDLAAGKSRLQSFFSANDKVEVKNLQLRRLVIEGERASTLATFELNAIEVRTGRPAMGNGKTTGAMSLVREAGEWKVWSETSAEEELAARLVAAKGEVERAALLAEDGELLTPSLATALFRAGERFRFRQDYEQTMAAYRLMLLVGERTASKNIIAAALHNIALVHRTEGEYEQALELAEKSLKLKEEIGAKASLPVTLSLIGNVFLNQGDYAQALVFFQRMLMISEEVNDKRRIAEALRLYGDVHDFQGNSAIAQDYYQRSLTLSQEAGDRIGVSYALQEIGLHHLKTGNYGAALELFRKNLALLEGAGHKAGIAHALRDIGKVFSAQGDHSQALENYQKALSLSEGTGFKEGTADILRIMALEYLNQGDYEKAIEHGQRSAGLERQMGSLWRLANSLTFAGQAYQALGRADEARGAFDEAIAAIETLRTQLAGGEQERQQYFGKRTSPYYAMVELLIAQNRHGEALAYAERAKGRVLLDVLRGGRVSITKTMTVRELEHEKKLAGAIATLNRQNRAESAQKQPDQARLAELNARLEKVRLDHEDFQTRLYTAHPELRVKRGEIQPFSLEQAGELLADSKTALLEYVVAGDKTFLFALTAGVEATTRNGLRKPVLKVYDLKVKHKDLVGRVNALNRRIANNDIEFAALAADLYDLLIGPAKAQLQGKTRLIIVPDDILWETPFQALRPTGGQYLIQTAAISYAPSLTVLREMIESKRNRFASHTLLAMGNPRLADQTISHSKSLLMGTSLAPLPEAERMVKQLAQMYGAAASRVYVGDAAREDVLKAEAGKYRTLQLATHGVLNNASPMYSHVVLAHTEGAAGEDGLLEAWEIMNLDLKADLAVLSACETARGRIGAGEGVIGLSWAMFVAGVPTTVVSQWKVESSSTTALMLEFHKGLRSGAGKSEAMRRAAMKLMAERRYEHPFYWAGFIVVGDGN